MATPSHYETLYFLTLRCFYKRRDKVTFNYDCQLIRENGSKITVSGILLPTSLTKIFTYLDKSNINFTYLSPKKASRSTILFR